MHIVLLPSWYPTNSSDIRGSFFREQAIALAKRNLRVGVVYPSLTSLRQLPKIFSDEFGLRIENDNGVITYRNHGVSWFPRMRFASDWLYLRRGEILFKKYVADYGKPDLIHVHSILNAGALALQLAKRYDIPYVVTEHSSGFARNVFSNAQLTLARSVARNAIRRFAVSRSFSELLLRKLGPDSGVWEVLPNIVQQKFLDEKLSVYKSDSGNFEFLTLAILTPNKGIQNLIRAFALRFAGIHGINLSIGGDGTYRSYLESLVQDLGIQGQVRFLGKLTRAQVVRVISETSVFVLPSRYETFGVVLVEALALGKPVIATQCGGPESIVGTSDGLLVPVDDIDALARAMEYLKNYADDYDPQEMRERCRSRYSAESILSRLESIYDEVLGIESN